MMNKQLALEALMALVTEYMSEQQDANGAMAWSTMYSNAEEVQKDFALYLNATRLTDEDKDVEGNWDNGEGEQWKE